MGNSTLQGKVLQRYLASLKPYMPEKWHEKRIPHMHFLSTLFLYEFLLSRELIKRLESTANTSNFSSVADLMLTKSMVAQFG
jgi:hypothetical protein